MFFFVNIFVSKKMLENSHGVDTHNKSTVTFFSKLVHEILASGCAVEVHNELSVDNPIRV